MKNKKIVSIILAIVLCLMATIVVVTANTKTASVEISTDKSELASGESATVSVKVTTNFPVATMSIPVFYDKTMVSVSDATATLTDFAVKNATTDSQSVNSSKVYANTSVSEDTYGFVLVNYIGSAGAQAPETIDGVVLTFTITANSGVEGDALINCVSESAKTSDNVAGMLYFGSTTSGTTIDSIPENVENIDLTAASKTVSIVAKQTTPNTIAIKEDALYSPVIDTVNKGEFAGIIYGIDILEGEYSIANFLTTSNGDEYLEIVVGDYGVETTGTIINVLDAESNVIEKYVFVYFGDIDCDGMITSTDGFFAEYYEANGDGLDEMFQIIAGDVDGDGMLTSTDGFFMEYFEANGEGIPTQQEIAKIVAQNVYEI